MFSYCRCGGFFRRDVLPTGLLVCDSCGRVQPDTYVTFWPLPETPDPEVKIPYPWVRKEEVTPNEVALAIREATAEMRDLTKVLREISLKLGSLPTRQGTESQPPAPPKVSPES